MLFWGGVRRQYIIFGTYNEEKFNFQEQEMQSLGVDGERIYSDLDEKNCVEIGKQKLRCSDIPL